jgi:hypothetical protein
MNETVAKLKSNMGFMGTFYQVIGVLYCISILGAIFGIPLYISGSNLKKAIKPLEGIEKFEDDRIEASYQHIISSFRIQKIIAIVSIVFAVLYIVFVIAFSAPILASMNGSRVS